MTAKTFPHPAEDASTITDAEFLQQLAWDRLASPELVAAARRGDAVKFAHVWKRRFRERNDITSARELLAGWSAALSTDEKLSRAIAALQRPARSRALKHRGAMKPVASWSVRVQPLVKLLIAPHHMHLQSPLGLLCALELLTTATSSLPHKLWWPLWRATVNSALGVGRSALAEVDQSSSNAEARTPNAVSPDVQLLVSGELPLLAGLVFSDVAGSAALVQRGRRFLKKELVARADTDGTPHSELLPRLPLWLAPLIRSTLWANQFGTELWSEDERRLLSDVSERAVALCRGDGRSALTNGLPMASLPVLTKAAELFQWSESNPSLGSLKLLQRQVRGPKRRAGARKSAIHVMPSSQSDWARLALLRTDWSPAADSVAIAHHQRLPQIDVTAGGVPVLHGPWDLRVQLGDTLVELADEWSCSCWESDPDGDYAELQMLGPNGLRVERLVFLSRKDRFVLMADSVSRAPQGRIELTSRWPLATDIEAEPDTNSRAVVLNGPRCRGRAFPLALPSSRLYSTPHRFGLVDGHLELHQVVEGHGLVAPLIFDWHPQRRSKDAEWRTLTISENTRAAASDAAAGYRLRVGSSQWLFYRSLKKTQYARAVLGHHTFHETVVARFDASGDTEPLIMIES
jgi:hypothetical protein